MKFKSPKCSKLYDVQRMLHVDCSKDVQGLHNISIFIAAALGCLNFTHRDGAVNDS